MTYSQILKNTANIKAIGKTFILKVPEYIEKDVFGIIFKLNETLSVAISPRKSSFEITYHVSDHTENNTVLIQLFEYAICPQYGNVYSNLYYPGCSWILKQPKKFQKEFAKQIRQIQSDPDRFIDMYIESFVKDKFKEIYPLIKLDPVTYANSYSRWEIKEYSLVRRFARSLM